MESAMVGGEWRKLVKRAPWAIERARREHPPDAGGASHVGTTPETGAAAVGDVRGYTRAEFERMWQRALTLSNYTRMETGSVHIAGHEVPLAQILAGRDSADDEPDNLTVVATVSMDDVPVVQGACTELRQLCFLVNGQLHVGYVVGVCVNGDVTIVGTIERDKSEMARVLRMGRRFAEALDPKANELDEA
jgi:hypothetical protein